MHQFVTIVLFLVFSLSLCSKVEQDLTSKLLNNYDKKIRPSSDLKEPVNVGVGIALNKLTNINEDKGEANLGLSVAMKWNDLRLSWNPSDYKNLRKITLASKQVWLPDMTFNTGYGVVEKILYASDFDLTVQSNGFVDYVEQVNQVVPCIFVDEKSGLQCGFSVESWAHPTDILNVTSSLSKVDTSLLGTYYDKRYKIKDTVIETQTHSYPDSPEDKYVAIKARILLEKTKA